MRYCGLNCGFIFASIDTICFGTFHGCLDYHLQNSIRATEKAFVIKAFFPRIDIELLRNVMKVKKGVSIMNWLFANRLVRKIGNLRKEKCKSGFDEKETRLKIYFHTTSTTYFVKVGLFDWSKRGLLLRNGEITSLISRTSKSHCYGILKDFSNNWVQKSLKSQKSHK